MVPIIQLISQPKIDLGAMFLAASQALGTSISKSIDNGGKLTDPAKFVIALSEFGESSNLPARQQLEEAGHELFFLHYSFLVYADRETIEKVRERTRLTVSSRVCIDGNIIAMVGGTLDEWRGSCIECASAKSTFTLRLLFDKFILSFETLGLADVWADYRRKSMPDKTFLIEEKK